MSPSSSDTESEPDDNLFPSPQFTLPQFIVSTSSSDLDWNETDAHDLPARVKALDIHQLESDRSLDDHVLAIYATLVAFFDNFSEGLDHSNVNTSAQLVTYAALVDVSSIRHLFALRALYRRLAAGSVPGDAAGVVSWVDVVLAKICEATLVICQGVPRTRLGQSLRAQLSDRLIQTASQLPNNMDSVVRTIDSPNSSPAAQRLALAILFASVIIGPQLTGEAYDDVLLRESINDHSGGFLLQIGEAATARPGQHPADSMREDEKVSTALALALYAETQREAASRPFTPHTDALLLDLLDGLFAASKNSSPAVPMMELDSPQTIIIRWCTFVPWVWRTWSNSGYVHGQSMVSLSSSWLYYLNRPLFTSSDTPDAEIDFPPIIYEHAGHALVLCARLLRETSEILAPPSSTSGPTQVVLHHACILITELYRYLSPTQGNSTIDEQLADYLSRMFILLRDENEVLAQTKELIIEALVLLDPDTRSTGLRAAFKGVERFAARTDHFLSRARSALSTYKSEIELKNAAHGMKRSLNFVSIMWHSGLHDALNIQGIQSSLFSVISLLAHDDKKLDMLRQVLRPSLFICLAIFESYNKVGRTWKVDFVWQLAQFNGDEGARVVAASCFSHVILRAKEVIFACSPLSCARAWCELRDILLLILSNDLIGDAGLIGIAVCSTICRALTVILDCSPPGAAAYIIGSPWLLSVHDALTQLFAEDEDISPFDPQRRESQDYCRILRVALEDSGHCLLRLISHHLHLNQGDWSTQAQQSEELVYDWVVYSGSESPVLLLIEKPRRTKDNLE